MPEYEQTVALFEKAVLNGKRDLNNAEFAKLRLAKLEAAEKTKKAMEFHRQAQAWEWISTYLAPNCIPSEMLSEALKPINDRLAESSSITGWNRVTILDL